MNKFNIIPTDFEMIHIHCMPPLGRETPLQDECLYGTDEGVRRLLAQGEDPMVGEPSPLELVVGAMIMIRVLSKAPLGHEKHDKLRTLLASPHAKRMLATSGRDALARACVRNDIQAVRMLMEHGIVDVDAHGRGQLPLDKPALIVALEYGNVHTAATLVLEYDATVTGEALAAIEASGWFGVDATTKALMTALLQARKEGREHSIDWAAVDAAFHARWKVHAQVSAQQYCAHCGRSDGELSRCGGGCKRYQLYCGKKCQRAAWPLHRLEH